MLVHNGQARDAVARQGQGRLAYEPVGVDGRAHWQQGQIVEGEGQRNFVLKHGELYLKGAPAEPPNVREPHRSGNLYRAVLVRFSTGLRRLD